MHGDMCKCPHHKVVPALIVIVGLAFLLQRFGILSADAVGVIWPLALIVGGLMKAFGGNCSCCKMGEGPMGGQKM